MGLYIKEEKSIGRFPSEHGIPPPSPTARADARQEKPTGIWRSPVGLRLFNYSKKTLLQASRYP